MVSRKVSLLSVLSTAYFGWVCACRERIRRHGTKKRSRVFMTSGLCEMWPAEPLRAWMGRILSAAPREYRAVAAGVQDGRSQSAVTWSLRVVALLCRGDSLWPTILGDRLLSK